MAQRFGIEFKQKRMFFDRAAVVAQIGKRKAAFLSKVGAFVQRRARSSLRRRKRPSAAGQPPSVHSTSDVATLKAIWFAFDPQRESVVIGPLLLNVHSVTRGGFGPWHDTILSTGAVPGTLEHGGLIGVRKIQGQDGTWARVPLGRRRRAEQLVPVWKATAQQKAAATGVVRRPMRNGKGRMANFYLVPTPPSRIDWVRIAARPFMGPAGRAEMNNPKLWFSGSRKAA